MDSPIGSFPSSIQFADSEMPLGEGTVSELDIGDRKRKAPCRYVGEERLGMGLQVCCRHLDLDRNPDNQPSSRHPDALRSFLAGAVSKCTKFLIFTPACTANIAGHGAAATGWPGNERSPTPKESPKPALIGAV